MKMPKLQEMYTIVAIMCHRYERMFSQLFCFEQEKTLKYVLKKLLYTSKIIKKGRSTDAKKAFGT